jgi:hypothetical protein
VFETSSWVGPICCAVLLQEWAPSSKRLEGAVLIQNRSPIFWWGGPSDSRWMLLGFIYLFVTLAWIMKLKNLTFPYQNSDKSQKTYARFLHSSLVFFSRKLMLQVLELYQGMIDIWTQCQLVMLIYWSIGQTIVTFRCFFILRHFILAEAWTTEWLQSTIVMFVSSINFVSLRQLLLLPCTRLYHLLIFTIPSYVMK